MLATAALRQQKLLDIIGSIPADYTAQEHPVNAVQQLLGQLMELTGSTYGFVGELKKSDTPSQLHTITIINHAPEHSWNFTPALQEVASNGQPLIVPAGDSTPAFIGLPVNYQQQVLAIIGLAGNTSGYAADTITFLQPLLQILGHLHFHALRERETRQLQTDFTRLKSEWDLLMLTLDDILFEMNDQKIFTGIWCSNDNLLFRPREEVIGKTIKEALGEHAGTFDRLTDKLLETGENQEFVYPDIRQGLQNWYQLKLRLIKDKSPTPRRILLMIRNISEIEKKNNSYLQAQSELHRSNQLLGICQQMGKMGGWEFNVATGETYWTREVYELREVPHDYPLTFHSSVEFYHPDDRSVFIAAREALIHHKKPFDLELRHLSAKGKLTWMRTIGRAVFDNQGQLTHFRGIIMDITDKKDTELALTTARDNAQKAAQSRSDFLSVMSHEIRTPLNAIIGIAGILGENPAAEQAEVVRSLEFSAHHLLGLINDILDFSKMEAGKIELENIPFDPEALLTGLMRNYQPMAAGKGIELISRLDHLPATLKGDPVRLSQVLNNLLNNAIKFTSAGSVTLDVRRRNASAGACTLSFAVKDTGVGIVPEMQAKIFDTFVQEDSATTRHHGGTGLGLAITKKLVALHNSNIVLESKKNEGTTFRFDINFTIPETARGPMHKKNKHREGYLKNMKLLVVEDNSINIRILELQLKNSGAQIETASNGKLALQKIQQQSFDGIILDLHMPEMNGYETIPHIQQLQPDAFIIVLTADIMPEVTERLARLHVKDMLPKPYAAEDLLEILERHRKT
ncbi:ATP-binding protein [Chitinophaga ginsengisegetis]|uniref:ATP-binding protein n=1 Tax=Chitinophaga ginsengisegetis TaxID=393003 RepID=UPI000DB9043D|nr:ATP-binding protein [Chitinophaga ginsengisegetis]MDR6570486.1 signal transduction histidine kinase [Chitinophaga ginsengisegetis]MDR6650220.1 signal transduction histidine kinase [Chitinophaga ginsengisegetis]MDR6656661.1 signal transduction histidine kinase [Chitinophaga ginsengisegetis]